MARPTLPARFQAAPTSAPAAQQVSGVSRNGHAFSSAAVYKTNRRPNPTDDRQMIAKPWQVEIYRHLNICGEARYAATLFANIAARAELGISEAQALRNKPTWITSGTEVEVLAEIMPTVRDRSKFIRDYMIHRISAGECYLIARERHINDPEYDTRPTEPVWEIVAVTELRRTGELWEVRYDNGNYVKLSPTDPVIRLWTPDPADRREAWSPFRSLLPTLREIEWLTRHIFAQVQSRLMSAGVWFLPDNLTFPPPPADAVEGGEETIAAMNEAEQFMASIASASMAGLDADEVAFPSVVMAAPEALASVDQSKLIQFWSEIDDKAMTLRSDAVRRFALGMDLPPEQVLGSSGMAVTGAGGSAGSSNHWCVDEETEILTRQGWVKQSDLRIGDSVYTLNHDTGLAEWNNVSDIYRAEVTDEPLVRMKGRDHDSLTTAKHRWPVLRSTTVDGVRTLVREFRLTEQLTEHDRIITAAPRRVFPSEPKFTDAFVELVAWFWTEGHLGPYAASISQSLDRNPQRVDRIRMALANEFHGEWTESVQTSGFNGSSIAVFHLHKSARDALAFVGGKRPHAWFIDSLTPAQLELFIDVSAQGDGWHYRQGRLDIWQREADALDAYERALILSGRMVSWGQHADGSFVSDRRGKSTVRPCKIGASSLSASVTTEIYSGVVWCPVTENSTWMARRNGKVYFTGNSVWANEEQTISAHVEPALDDLVGVLTNAVLRAAVEDTPYVVAYDTAALRLRQDRSKEALEWYDRGVLKAEVAVRESGFDPTNDMMSADEHKIWLLNRLAGGSATPEQVQAALALLGIDLPTPVDAEIMVDEGGSGGSEPASPGLPGRNLPPSLESHPYEGPPRVQHDHTEAPFSALHTSSEVLVLRALEKAGNRLLNDGRRGRDKDRTTPAHLAHVTMSVESVPEFDFSLVPTVFAGRPAAEQAAIGTALGRYCTGLYENGQAYSREGLIAALEGL